MRLTLLSSCAIATVLASSASADIAPDTLWQSWQHMAAQNGAVLRAGGINRQGEVLDLDEVTLDFGKTDERVRLTLDDARIEPGENGSAALIVPPDQRAVVELAAPESPSRTELDIGGEGLRVTATGALPDPAYTLISRQLVLTLAAPGTGRATGLEAAAAVFTGLQATIDGLGSGGSVTVEGTIAELSGTAETFDAPTETRAVSHSVQSEIALSARISPTDEQEPHRQVAVGLDGGPMTSETRVTGPEGVTDAASTSGATQLSAIAANGVVALSAEADKLALTARSDAFPAEPVELALDHMAIGASGPLLNAGTAALTLSLEDLTAGDALWSHFDPDGALPRSPANLSFAAEADLAPVEDDTREAFADRHGKTLPPLMPQVLTITDFSLDFAGAQMEAEGNFTLDTSALAGSEPVQPAGRLDVTLTGALTLLQRLSEGGIVPSQSALGTRMMLGLFTTPGDGATLTSTIETEPDGGLVINGTRLK